MSGRRRAPEPAIPVGGVDPIIAPPEEFVPPLGAPTFVDTEPPIIAGGLPPTEEDHRLVDSPAEEEPEAEDLSPEEQVMFASLLTCGRRTKMVKVLDHVVVVQTLNCDDDLRIGLWAKPYVASLGEQRAYQIGVAAAGIRSIDGQPFVNPLYSDADESALFDEKAAKVSKMYPHVVQRIHRAVLDAEKEFVALVDRLGKSSG